MSTLRQMKALAKKLGAKVEDYKCGDSHCCLVEAPHRKVWVDGGVHELETVYQPWKPDYDDIIERMNCGLDDCVGECDWCDGDSEVAS